MTKTFYNDKKTLKTAETIGELEVSKQILVRMPFHSHSVRLLHSLKRIIGWTAICRDCNRDSQALDC
jgi:hypothetical protein